MNPDGLGPFQGFVVVTIHRLANISAQLLCNGLITKKVCPCLMENQHESVI
jgi:hypothetical protein